MSDLTYGDAMILTYQYRLLPTKRQHQVLKMLLDSQRVLYNAALEERIDCYRKTGKSLSYFDQCKSLTICRDSIPEMGALPVNLLRWPLKKLDIAFAGFFRRIQSRTSKPGFPRFRSAHRWKSFGFAAFEGIRLVRKRLYFAGMPSGLKLHFHRPLPDNTDIRACAFRRDESGWRVSLKVTVEAIKKASTGIAVGLDLGLAVFAYCSDGITLPNPQFARKAERRLRVAQRAVTRCKNSSNRRRKAREAVAKTYRKITNTRDSWLHQQSAALVKRVDLIVVENLRVANMMKHPTLARSIADASWSKFLSMLAYKAEKAGARLIRVDPRNTSQRCSGCGELVPKSLAVRTHSCPHCGLVIDRDWNASLNILRAGLSAGWVT